MQWHLSPGFRGMTYSPSLPRALQKRSFHARNGELGIVPSDATAFLRACDTDGVRMLGCELWIVDHRWDSAQTGPSDRPAIGAAASRPGAA